jgi:hypothetical protein
VLDRREIGIQFPTGTSDVPLLYNVQTGSGAHPTSYTIGNAEYFPWDKKREGETDHSCPSSAVFKNGGALTPFSHTSLFHGV